MTLLNCLKKEYEVPVELASTAPKRAPANGKKRTSQAADESRDATPSDGPRKKRKAA